MFDQYASTSHPYHNSLWDRVFSSYAQLGGQNLPSHVSLAKTSRSMHVAGPQTPISFNRILRETRNTFNEFLILN